MGQDSKKEVLAAITLALYEYQGYTMHECSRCDNEYVDLASAEKLLEIEKKYIDAYVEGKI